jgi:hypothetical protein
MRAWLRALRWRWRTAPSRFTRDLTTYVALRTARPEDVPAILRAHDEWEL